MKSFLLLSCILAALAGVYADCDACLDGLCYKKTIVFEGFELSGQLAIDRTNNILYFHFENTHKNDFNGAFNLDDIRFQLIPGVDFTFGRAVDQSSRDLYMSAVTGVYKYNPSTNNTVLIGLNDKTIWQLQYKDKLYYAEFLTNGLYTYENKKTKSVAALANYPIDDFVVDKKGDIYFMSDFTIYRLKKGESQATVFADEIYSLTTDRNGNVFFLQPATRGIYKLNYKTNQITEVGALGSGIAFKAVFDNENNIIYHDVSDNKLYYLTISYNRCTVSVTGSGKQTKKTVAIADAA